MKETKTIYGVNYDGIDFNTRRAKHSTHILYKSAFIYFIYIIFINSNI